MPFGSRLDLLGFILVPLHAVWIPFGSFGFHFGPVLVLFRSRLGPVSTPRGQLKKTQPSGSAMRWDRDHAAADIAKHPPSLFRPKHESVFREHWKSSVALFHTFETAFFKRTRGGAG